MKKIMNDATQIVTEMVDGMALSYPEYVKRLDDLLVLVRSQEESMTNKVGLITGGGTGHEPASAGYIGEGMLSAVVCGQIFSSPTPDQILAAIQTADHGKGVFMIIMNYSGDIMNFDMAREMAVMDDIDVRFIVVDDDIAVEDSTYTQGRRGVAGTVLMEKILGAAADSGASLSEIEALAKQVLPNLKTIGVALSAATVPEVGKPGFTLAEDEVEYGVGIHSEPGYRREEMQPSAKLAEELLARLNDEFNFTPEDHYAVLVNGMGATPLMEQFVFMRDVLNQLADFGVQADFTKVGNFMTSLDMAGVSLTLLKLREDQWLKQLNYPVNTIAMVRK
ncbi:dihydroxyacetone kinase subunit DhaK [Levilactobacillus bambusae]|uniref:Dihydroxyacetone kinase subunit DhaK n=1 Tax=Levilactobacillus bambusae TaxID=2024736 RepID=A0A2V1MX94_9LACO|nr:dihydroxyacetone kinase subunit DhaK [Levilactobacillus bambusae]PWF99481.1 dihydroxyacetone kinase subunit DhaK [Levilactobacillus bambusae]